MNERLENGFRVNWATAISVLLCVLLSGCAHIYSNGYEELAIFDGEKNMVIYLGADSQKLQLEDDAFLKNHCIHLDFLNDCVSSMTIAPNAQESLDLYTYKGIHLGDTKEKALEVYGEPNVISDFSGKESLIYYYAFSNNQYLPLYNESNTMADEAPAMTMQFIISNEGRVTMIHYQVIDLR